MNIRAFLAIWILFLFSTLAYSNSSIESNTAPIDSNKVAERAIEKDLGYSENSIEESDLNALSAKTMANVNSTIQVEADGSIQQENPKVTSLAQREKPENLNEFTVQTEKKQLTKLQSDNSIEKEVAATLAELRSFLKSKQESPPLQEKLITLLTGIATVIGSLLASYISYVGLTQIPFFEKNKGFIAGSGKVK